MPNYSLVINSQFHPFSYQDMIAPVALATQAQQDLEDKYSTLGEQSGAYDKLANQQTDPIAYTQYKRYADDLSKQVEQLNKDGLTPSSRTALLNMKRRYSSEITPIDTAYKKREELAKEQRALRAQDTSAMFDVDYSTASLDKLLANPSASYTPVSGDALAKRAAEMALPLSKVISPETNRTLKTILGNQYALIQMGASPQDVMAAINNDKNAHPELRKIIDTVYSTSGLDTFDDASQKKGMAHIIRGLYSAIGGSNPVANGEYMNRAQRTSAAMQAAGLALDREKFNYAKDKDQQQMALAKIAHGLAPYAIDKNGNKYYSNGKNSWIIGKDGSYTKNNTDTKIKTSGVSYTPAYFDAWSKGAHNGFQPKTTNDADKNSPQISYGDIHGGKARDYIRQYVRANVLGASKLSDKSIDRLASQLDLHRELDWLSDDHFTINIPGTDEKGKIKDTVKYTQFMNNVQSELSNAGNYNTGGYNVGANAGL